MNRGIFIEMDLKDACRLCLCKVEVGMNIFECREDEVAYSQTMEDVFDIKVKQDIFSFPNILISIISLSAHQDGQFLLARLSLLHPETRRSEGAKGADKFVSGKVVSTGQLPPSESRN